MKNQITIARSRAQKVLAAFFMLLICTSAIAQMPGNGGGGGGGGHHGGHPGGGHPGGGHPGGGHGGPGGPGGPHHPMACNAHFVHHRDSVANGMNFRTFNGSGAATFAWDFGDGSTSTDQNPNHVFPDTGFYYVCLTVTDTIGGGCTNTWCDSLRVFTPAPRCNAHFRARGDSLANTLNFRSRPSSPGATYAWDFGDGSTSTDPAPQHTYAAAGIYYVCLTVTNTNAGGTCSDTKCDSVDTNMPAQPHHPGHHHREASATSSTDDISNATAKVSVYPNPMTENATIYLENTSGNATLRIYGINGQIVLTKQVGNGENSITKENLTEGLYFYSVEDSGTNVAKGKLRVN